jgi:hypothetical protein
VDGDWKSVLGAVRYRRGLKKLPEQQMIALDVLYIALATICVLAILQIFAYVATRVLYPPEPQIIYRNVPVQMQAPPPPPPPVHSPYLQQGPPQLPKNEPALTQQTQEVKLPEYEPRKPASDSLRLDAELPVGIQETRPPGL